MEAIGRGADTEAGQRRDLFGIGQQHGAAPESGTAARQSAETMVKDSIEFGEKLAGVAATWSEATTKDRQVMPGDLEEEEADEAFGDEYRAKMVSSHRRAVSLLEEVFRNSKDPGVRKLAGRMLPTLQAHGSRGRASRGAIGASRKAVE